MWKNSPPVTLTMLSFFDLPLYLLHKLLLYNQRFVDFLFIICCLAVAPKLIIPSGKLNNNRFRRILFIFYISFYVFLFLKTIIPQMKSRLLSSLFIYLNHFVPSIPISSSSKQSPKKTFSRNEKMSFCFS